jgi:hypothetical protein
VISPTEAKVLNYDLPFELCNEGAAMSIAFLVANLFSVETDHDRGAGIELAGDWLAQSGLHQWRQQDVLHTLFAS